MSDLFGKYCYIDTPWIAGKKTRYRIISSGFKSNYWSEVPVRGNVELVRHDHVEETVIVVLDTLVSDDSTLRRFALKDIEVIETEQPERKKGKWYKPTGMMPPEYAGVYRCSECDDIAMRNWKTHKQKLTDFCPNCGSYNGGGEE